MSENVYLKDTTLSAIGNAIRTKSGKSALILPKDMPDEILALGNFSIQTDNFSDSSGTIEPDYIYGVSDYYNGDATKIHSFLALATGRGTTDRNQSGQIYTTTVCGSVFIYEKGVDSCNIETVAEITEDGDVVATNVDVPVLTLRQYQCTNNGPIEESTYGFAIYDNIFHFVKKVNDVWTATTYLSDFRQAFGFSFQCTLSQEV